MNIFSPYYHTISNRPLPHIWPLYDVVKENEFIKHIDYLARKFDFIGPKKVLELVNGEEWAGSKPPAFLSFDDGLIECFTTIAPLLKQKGIEASFFVNPSFIDSDDIFFRYKIAVIIDALQNGKIEKEGELVLKEVLKASDHLKYTLEEGLLSMSFSDIEDINYLMRSLILKYRNSDIYMSSKQIQSLKNDGFYIGGHSMNHPLFSELNLEDQVTQIKESTDYCQAEFAEEMRLFAFPFYDFDVRKELYPRMYNELKIDLSFGTSGINKDEFSRSIQRLSMEESFANIKSYIKRRQLHYTLKKLVGKHVIRRPQ